MITKELLIKARDTLPQSLGQGKYYHAPTNQYCAVGWLAHCAGIIRILEDEDRLTDEFMDWENTTCQGFYLGELIKANDDCTFEFERYDRVKHVLDSWIERL